VEELVTVVDGIDVSVGSLLADAEVVEGLTVVAEAEADRETEAEEEAARLVVAAALLEATADEAEEAREEEAELAAALELLELTAAELLALGATEVVVVLAVSLPNTDSLYHPPHF
jgi:ribose/xylose/arabinose/galactoside ABC-type transport system permease subunit